MTGLTGNPSAVGVAAVGQIPATQTNDNAASTCVGYHIKSTVGSGSAVSLTSGSAVNITSLSLDAGDWDLNAIVNFTGNAATTVQYGACGISTTTGTLPNFSIGDTNRADVTPGATPFANDAYSCVTGPFRLSLASTTAVYLVAVSGFSVNTQSAFGTLRARRVR